MFSLFKKRATVDELGSTFALYVQGHLPGSTYNEEYVDTGFGHMDDIDIDKNLFQEERQYLRTFAVDYGISLELGVHNPKRNAVLDVCIDCLSEMASSGKLPADFMAKCIERSADYTEAVKTPSNIGPHYNVGKVFASLFGYGLNSSIVFRTTLLFSSDIYTVTSMLKSFKITF